MAQTVVIGHNTYKKRSPVGVWLGLPLITLGIYGLVWYYKINDEERRYLEDDSIKPGIALLAILLGWILIVPPFVSIYKTCGRVKRMEERAGVAGRIEPVLGLVLAFVFSLHVFYIQSHLNGIWDVYLRVQTPAPPAPAMPPQS